jgi:hypothetical protein
MTSPLSLLLRRRRSKRVSSQSDSTDGLMDILSNVVGVMALVGSLTGVFAATSSLNILAPMQTKSDRNFWTIQASQDGIWNLQPAIDLMTVLDRERVSEVILCDQLLQPERVTCEKNLDNWAREEQLGSISMSLSHASGSIQRTGPPVVTAADLSKSDGWLDQTMKRLAREKKAIFVVLENDGFELYRAIKSKAIQYKVPIGWEPWYEGDPIYFWGNSGRSMMVQ